MSGSVPKLPTILDDVTVIIPSYPKREGSLLTRALTSVYKQTKKPGFVIIECDMQRFGSARNKDNAVARVSTEWTAFLDDDDEWLPHHLAGIHEFALENDADYVYSDFTVVGGKNPHSWWDAHTEYDYHQFTTGPCSNLLIRTEWLKEVTWSVALKTEDLERRANERRSGARPGIGSGDDQRLPKAIVRKGGKVAYWRNKSVLWHHHGKNTGGLPL